ncbi:MAG: SagB/ThcOx family dehydrogenase [Planctomycetaceae bacterium]|nr:SagB/ThcOx family dehydrogenase [Planctomycetaceae bacterium]
MSTTLFPQRIVPLPPAIHSGGKPLHEVLSQRRSCRTFRRRHLSPTELSQLCWAAQGVTSTEGARTSPSAGGLFPVTVLVATEEGLFEYLPRKHALWERQTGDMRTSLQRVAFDQPFLSHAAATFILAIDIGVTAAEYSRLAQRYCDIEVGHVSQNLLLEATSLGLGCVPVGLFDENLLRSALNLGSKLEPVYLLPVGEPASRSDA